MIMQVQIEETDRRLVSSICQRISFNQTSAAEPPGYHRPSNGNKAMAAPSSALVHGPLLLDKHSGLQHTNQKASSCRVLLQKI
jgi:hypothetical protein